LSEREGEFGDFWADWKDVYSNVADAQLCFSNMELYQVGAVEEEGKSVSWDPVTAVEVARAEEGRVQVLLEESAQLRGTFTQRRVPVFKVQVSRLQIRMRLK